MKACVLIRQKEKQLILFNGSAKGAAELVVAKSLARSAGLIPKEIISVEVVIAAEIPKASVIPILSTRLSSGDAAAPPSNMKNTVQCTADALTATRKGGLQ